MKAITEISHLAWRNSEWETKHVADKIIRSYIHTHAYIYIYI